MIDWELILFVSGAYFVFFWGLPMLGVPSDDSVRRQWPNMSTEDWVPYWKAVREVSLMFHIAAAIAWGAIALWLIPAIQAAS